MQRITIIGLGLIGGSLGLALKEANGHKITIVGYSRRPETITKALDLGCIDEAAWDLGTAVSKSTLVIIATPVLRIKEVLKEISIYVDSGCIITDVGSTKADIIRWADECLPEGVNFIGGHPMAGKETSGLEEVEADLFKGCVYCLVLSSRASEDAVKTLTKLVRSIGAIPMPIDAELHDSLVAGVSHLPIVLSAAFVSATTSDANWSEMSKLAASGYRDVSRLASGNPEMNNDICMTNKNAIIRWIDNYVEELMRYRTLISESSQGLMDAFIWAKSARDKWIEEDKCETTD